MKRILVAAAIITALDPDMLGAQGGIRRPLAGRRIMEPQQPPDSMIRNRVALEGEVGARIARAMQQRFGTTDAQMAKVRGINQRYAPRRQLLDLQEREIRMSLREEAIAADSTRATQVADLLDRMLRARRQRIELLEQEQRELATVLTPHQRAMYIGFEEQMRQRLEQTRQGLDQGRRGRLGGLPPDGANVPPPNGFARGRQAGPPRRPPPPDAGRVPPGG